MVHGQSNNEITSDPIGRQFQKIGPREFTLGPMFLGLKGKENNGITSCC